jgi:hypothetical protein
MNLNDVKGEIVRVVAPDNKFALFRCSDVIVDDSIAGKWLDDDTGVMMPSSRIKEVVAPDIAQKELETWKRSKDKARIKEVVTQAADAQEEFSGNIILHVAFSGSLQKTKALTKTEQATLLKAGMPSGLQGKIKSGKQLFESEEYDDLVGFIARRRAEFGNLGIPFPLGVGMHLVRITNIPKAEQMAKQTERDLANYVERLVKAYPNQITKEATGLDVLYNPGDYKPVESLPSLFRLQTKWMHFGVPDVLKEIDIALYEAELARTKQVWNEARENGIILLRQQVADMVTRLVEAVSPDKDGNKKRFYGTTITNLQDFFAVFDDRNLGDDRALADQVEKLKALISGKEIESFKTDDKLREFVKKEGSKIQTTMEAMLVEAGARTISFIDE